MFVVLMFGGRVGHSGLLLTGLDDKSCFLHLTGTSYPKQRYSIDNTYGGVLGRVLIPTIEDGNPYGLSESQALDYWRYYKKKTYDHSTWGAAWKENNPRSVTQYSDGHAKNVPQNGREGAFNIKYSNENHNCSLFVNRFLIAASLDQNIDIPSTGSGRLFLKHIWTGPIPSPWWVLDKARLIRDAVLTELLKRRDTPIYGFTRENEHQYNTRQCYTPADNLKYDVPQKLAAYKTRAEILTEHMDQNLQTRVLANPHYQEDPRAATHKFKTGTGGRTWNSAPNHGLSQEQITQLVQKFSTVKGL